MANGSWPAYLEDWQARDAIHLAGLRWQDEPRFFFDKRVCPSPYNNAITTHYCSPVRMRWLYDAFRPIAARSVSEGISKRIHFTWFGPDPLPSGYKQNIQSWAHHHPDWQITLWTDKNLPSGWCMNQTHNPAQRSQMARYLLLHEFGGLYVDCDMQCLRPLDDLLAGSCGFAAAEDDDRICCALIGSQAGDPVMRRCMNRLPFTYTGSEKCDFETGSGFFTDTFFKCKPSETANWRIASWQSIYPKHWSGREMGPMQDAFTNHQWAAGWRMQGGT